MQSEPRAWLELDPAALTHNLQTVSKMAPDASIMAVIKANGYGHGLELAAHALRDAQEFATTDFREAKELRLIDAEIPITPLSGDFQIEDLVSIDGHNIRPVVFNRAHVDALKGVQLNTPLDVWLKVDTGMGRLGFASLDIASIVQQLDGFSSVASVSLMTHMANADDANNPSSTDQLKRLLALQDAYAWRDVSIFNSGALCLNNDGSSLDAVKQLPKQVVRPGLMLYGLSPMLIGSSVGNDLGLRAAMTFKARVISVNRVSAGTTIGYGSTYTTDSDTNIATIACGYADGYPRHLPSGTPVLINDHKVPLVGRVSMDLITVDVKDLPIARGDIAVLWGPQNPVEVIAQMSQTIAYDLLVGVMPRVKRKTI